MAVVKLDMTIPDSGMTLSKFGILVAQLNSIVESASQQPPDPLLCFDLLSDLVSTIEDESKVQILQYQRKCEDLLQSLIIFGARRPVRHLASTTMLQFIEKGDNISIYSRASAFQGWLAETRKADPLSYIGAAQCLGDLYRFYGRKITSGMAETSNIVTKMMKSSEVGVRQAALHLLQNAIEGSEGAGPSVAYSEAFRAVMRVGVVDKSFAVRIAAAGCLKAFATTGGPGLASVGLEQSASVCVKAMEDPVSSVRDAFAEALGAVLSLGLNPDSEVVSKGKTHLNQTKTLEGGLLRHLIGPFMKASGLRCKEIRVGLTMAWVSFLQGMHSNYLQRDAELQNFALQAIEMLRGRSTIDAHAQACVLYILRVGVVDQMCELTQKDFLILLSKQLCLPDASPSMIVVILRTLSFLLDTLGEVPPDAKDMLDNSLMSILSNSSKPVRVEAALTLRALSEVDSSCAGGLISSGLTTLRALCETVAIEKGEKLIAELNDFHGQAAMLACLAAAACRLPLGIPSRLPSAILEVAKQLTVFTSRNVVSAGAVKEAGWMLLAAVISSMPIDELEEQEFDILALWTVPFSGKIEQRLKEAEESLDSTLCVWSMAMEALTVFVKSYVVPALTSMNGRILLQPVLGYLSGALTYVSSLRTNQQYCSKAELDHFTVRTLIAYQALPNPMAYESDHSKLISLCTFPFRDPSNCEESSCLRLLLDPRDAVLGPWTLGRDSFEDELRAFEGGSDGPLPCLWEKEVPIFPQPVSLSTYLVNEMLLCFGNIFAAEESMKKFQLLDSVGHSLKTGKKQSWHQANVTNCCVGLLAGLKASIRLRPGELDAEVLQHLQLIFQAIITEEGTSLAQRRAAAEGLGLLARLGTDTYAARLARLLISDVNGVTNSFYKASVALTLGCIHRSAGGMALSALLSSTIQSLCMMAKDPKDPLRVWSLHGLCLTIESGGLSCVPFVQSILALSMDVLLSEEHTITELYQNIGRLINAVVAVLGPELSPGSSFFSRCKSVIVEIGSAEDPSVSLECVRFIQQLVLFAPQAMSVHSHVQTLKSTLFSRQPILRQAAILTLRHLAESDPVSTIEARIEEDLFSMLDKETDLLIGKLVRTTLDRLLDAACPSCPSRWLQICRNVVLAATSKKNSVSGYSDVETMQNAESLGDDDEGMIVNPKKDERSDFISNGTNKTDQMPRYRTRVYAAECLSRIPDVVGGETLHFDLMKARRHVSEYNGADLLVMHLSELVALAYQISTGSFEKMQPLGVRLLCTIVEKFERTVDPELPGHFLIEQYQAQLVSAVRTALDPNAGVDMLDSGLQLATKILTSSITNGDQVVLQRMYTMISRPLANINDIHFPAFAEWAESKIKIRILAAHAAVKAYGYYHLNSKGNNTEYMVLLPLFSKNSVFLGPCWVRLLQDCTFLHTQIFSWKKYNPFLDGIQSGVVASVLQPMLKEVWPVILLAATLDAVPVNFASEKSCERRNVARGNLTSLPGYQYEMLKLEQRDFNFLWSLAILLLFDQLNKGNGKKSSISSMHDVIRRLPLGSHHSVDLKCIVVALHSILSLSKRDFCHEEFLSRNLCTELFQILMYPGFTSSVDPMFTILSILEQILKYCPESYINDESFQLNATELCMQQLHTIFGRESDYSKVDDLVTAALETAKVLVHRINLKKQMQLVPSMFHASYTHILAAETARSINVVKTFMTDITVKMVEAISALLKSGEGDDDVVYQIELLLSSLILNVAQYCDHSLYSKINKNNDVRRRFLEKLPQLLELMVNFLRSILAIEFSRDRGNSEKGIWKSTKSICINCIRKTLSVSDVEIQMAGLHVLKTLAQMVLANTLKNEGYYLVNIVFGELITELFDLIQNYQGRLQGDTNQVVSAVGEALKLFIPLHSLIKDIELQENILHLILEGLLSISASFEKEKHLQVGNGLRNISVKFVEHLAKLPSSASQIRNVLLGMPDSSRQKLQEIIRASVIQDSASTQRTALPITLPLVKQSPQPSPADEGTLPQSDSNVHLAGKNLDNEEDEWDTFQSYPVPSLDPSMGDVKNSSISEDPADQETDIRQEDWDDFQESSGSISAIDSTFAGNTENDKPISSPGKEDPRNVRQNEVHDMDNYAESSVNCEENVSGKASDEVLTNHSSTETSKSEKQDLRQLSDTFSTEESKTVEGSLEENSCSDDMINEDTESMAIIEKTERACKVDISVGDADGSDNKACKVNILVGDVDDSLESYKGSDPIL